LGYFPLKKSETIDLETVVSHIPFFNSLTPWNMGFLRAESSDNPYTDYDSTTPAWLVENERILAENATATNGTATTGGGIDWTLQNCCKKDEFALIGLMGGYLLIIAILWTTVLMKPLKLIAVFVHGTSDD
jgi:hypothetical protein